MADNYVALERARGLTYAAAARLDDPATSAAAGWNAAALAKAAAAEAAVGCGRTAVQVHGALAQTWEHDMHLYLRHAWQGASTLGDSRALYNAVGRRFAGSRADDDAERSYEVGARPLAAARLGVPPPAYGGEWRS